MTGVSFNSYGACRARVSRGLVTLIFDLCLETVPRVTHTMKEVYTVHQILTFSIFCDFSTFLTISSDRQKKVKSLIFGIIDGVNKVVAFSLCFLSLYFFAVFVMLPLTW